MPGGRRSLYAGAGTEEGDESPWPAFGDIALALLLVFILFILAQFLHYDRIFILERLEARQDSVKSAILEVIPAARQGGISIESLDEYHQRVTFQADLLFAACSGVVTETGRGLVQVIGAALHDRAHYFETLQVEGHTDVMPLGDTCKRSFLDNWALSSERATAVVRILSDSLSLGVPALLSSVGRGEYHPVGLIEPGDTTSTLLARHRRIELVLQYTDRGILEIAN